MKKFENVERRVVINGEFYDHKITGVQRYAREIIQKLDEFYGENRNRLVLELLIPKDVVNTPKLKNIKIVKYKRRTGWRKIIWTHWNLHRYCKKNNAYCLCLHSFAPFFYTSKSIDVIHDCATLAHPEFYNKKTLLYYKYFLWKKVKKLKHIITVSQFSKSELIKYCGLSEDRITVAYNSYEHFREVRNDNNIFEKYPVLKECQYCYTLSSLSPNKNLKWVIEVARNNPEYYFVISGAKFAMFSQQHNELLENVIYTDYVTDEEAKSLMEHCKLYLFPTLYEGFGITPLEAILVGADVVVSDTPCMREIYEGVAEFVNPFKYDYKINHLLPVMQKEKSAVLERFSWRKSAEIIWNLLAEL